VGKQILFRSLELQATMAADEVAAGLMVDVWVAVPQVAFQATNRIAVEGTDQRLVFFIIQEPSLS
jgi:hypothetical protein